MIGSLRGKLISKGVAEVLVEAAGVGYLVHVPLNTLSNLPAEGREVFLLIHTHVREDAITLYGFSSSGEKDAFITLLGITGIGPKVALNIISGLPYDEFYRAVESEDITMLTKIPGLGKKTANRIVLELKGKLPGEGAAVSAAGGVHEDSLSALVNLGYKKSEALQAIEAVKKKGHDALEDILKSALKYLNGDR